MSPVPHVRRYGHYLCQAPLDQRGVDKNIIHIDICQKTVVFIVFLYIEFQSYVLTLNQVAIEFRNYLAKPVLGFSRIYTDIPYTLSGREFDCIAINNARTVCRAVGFDTLSGEN